MPAGKKKLILAIEEVELLPPTPAVAAISKKIQYGVSAGRCTKIAKRVVGKSSNSALATVQLRPPNLGTAKV